VSQTARSTTPDPSSLATPSPGDAGPRAAGRGDIRAVIPALRVAARDLADGPPLRADELVRDTIVQALRDWDRRPADADLGAWLTGLLADRSRAGGAPA
jgi:DNA-directed RNA polymerase specialized sigma24 family protein